MISINNYIDFGYLIENESHPKLFGKYAIYFGEEEIFMFRAMNMKDAIQGINKDYILKNIDSIVDHLYDKMFERYYSPSKLSNWSEDTYFGGGNKYKYINRIKELLLNGYKVKTGYKGNRHKTHVIFYKKLKY